ncbi:MAG: sensor histidine kinase N-terminal domain-containing protein [Rhodocyclaceae bacterium]|nr:sensor histidine kinase N-terminal domain-containing protein [Rhodocyclaceae bacterium]
MIQTNNQLRNKLLARVLIPMAIVMAVSGVIGYYQARNFVNASYDRSLLEEARGLAEQVQVSGKDVFLDMPPVADEMLRADSADHIYYQIRIVDGEVVAGDMVLPAPPDTPQRVEYYDTFVQGEAVRVVSIPRSTVPMEPAIVIQFAETLHKRKALANEIVVAVMAPQFALMVLAWFAIQQGIRVGLRPLKTLTRSIEQRSPADLAPLPIAAVPQELLPLMSAFNAMLLRLGNAADVQKRFVADAAHQLRTPLAALRIQLERALREPDPAVREHLLQQLVGAIERTARLSSQLLLLARAEPGGETVQPGERFDLCALAFNTGSNWIPRALQQNVDLGLDTPAHPIFVRGEPLMTGELINNLIDNALRYGGAQITLRVSETPQGVELSVEDDGPGVPAAEAERVFERFYRVPGNKVDGSGLGLSIVREIAHGFGAECGYRQGAGGGACFFVLFPNTPEAEPEA